MGISAEIVSAGLQKHMDKSVEISFGMQSKCDTFNLPIKIQHFCIRTIKQRINFQKP